MSLGEKRHNADDIEIKIQSNLFKKSISVTIGKKDTFMVAVIKCAEEINAKPENIKLKFDGELLNIKECPNDLDFEGGELLDMILTTT